MAELPSARFLNHAFSQMHGRVRAPNDEVSVGQGCNIETRSESDHSEDEEITDAQAMQQAAEEIQAGPKVQMLRKRWERSYDSQVRVEKQKPSSWFIKTLMEIKDSLKRTANGFWNLLITAAAMVGQYIIITDGKLARTSTKMLGMQTMHYIVEKQSD